MVRLRCAGGGGGGARGQRRGDPRWPGPLLTPAGADRPNDSCRFVTGVACEVQEDSRLARSAGEPSAPTRAVYSSEDQTRFDRVRALLRLPMSEALAAKTLKRKRLARVLARAMRALPAENSLSISAERKCAYFLCTWKQVWRYHHYLPRARWRT